MTLAAKMTENIFEEPTSLHVNVSAKVLSVRYLPFFRGLQQKMELSCLI